MAFLNNTLFLCGNLTQNNGFANIGRLCKFDLNFEHPKPVTVFNTVEYGTNKTTFDHGWNALAISPDKKYIYVNSGSRTDQGEVQDNDGRWPNARDGALTAKIFRFPVDSENLLLENDEVWLKSQQYIFAEGIRNGFGLAFNNEDRLFCAVNSGDYDHAEDMFWIREGYHYGFPWVMGGTENPQQYSDWQPNYEEDPFLNRRAYASMVGYFHNDPDFPKKPDGLVITSGIKNFGPDANEHRDRKTGKVMTGDNIQEPVTTFTPHSSPVGLIFDVANSLPTGFTGDGFLLRYMSTTMPLSLLGLFTEEGSDLLHLKLLYDRNSDNYHLNATALISGFNQKNSSRLCLGVKAESMKTKSFHKTKNKLFAIDTSKLCFGVIH